MTQEPLSPSRLMSTARLGGGPPKSYTERDTRGAYIKSPPCHEFEVYFLVKIMVVAILESLDREWAVFSILYW
jgi:hypothetical protein